MASTVDVENCVVRRRRGAHFVLVAEGRLPVEGTSTPAALAESGFPLEH